jgi:hypothetical protein
MASPSPPTATAAGPAPTASTPAAHAALTSFCPPYATDSSTETRFPHSVAWRASWRHCCCPVMSASSANTSAHVLYPVPLPAVDAADGHYACHPCGQQRERIERALAHPQRAVTLRQRGGMLCCRRKVSPRLPGRAAWNTARWWAKSGRTGVGSRGAGVSAGSCLPAAGGLGSLCGGWRRCDTRCQRAGGLRKAAWRSCSSRHRACAVSI